MDLAVLLLVVLLVIAALWAQHRLEESRRLANSQLRLLDMSGLGTFEVDGATGRVQCSPRIQRWLKVPGDSGSVGDWTASLEAEFAETLRSNVEACLSTGQRFEVEILQGEDGEEPVTLRCVGVCDAFAGRAPRVVGIVEDISARRAAERGLELERARLIRVIEGPNLGTWEWNVQTGETVFNERWAEIIGYTLADLSPVSIETWMKFSHPEDLQQSNELLQSHFAGQSEVYDCECRMQHRDGHWIWVHDRGRVISWTEDGKPLMMAGTHWDITEYKRTESAKVELQRQLVQSQKMESVGRLAGGVAHDFNNMLSVILGRSSMLLADMDESHAMWGDLHDIEQVAYRSAALTRQLLAFSKRQVAAPRPISLNMGIRDTYQILSRLAGETISLSFDAGVDLPNVLLDPAQLDQILANLVVNARDAMPDGGEIAIQTRLVELTAEQGAQLGGAGHGSFVRLTVSDTGAGIAEEVLAHIFEPFFTTKAEGQGTGLGLSTVYGIAHQNGGMVTVSSVMGEGCSFDVYLPVTDVAPAAKEAEAEVVERSGMGRCVLVVDDEKMLLDMVGSMLRIEGFEVIEAGSGAEALERARAHQGDIHLLVADVIMPGMNGPALAEKLLALRPSMRCLFVSGHAAQVLGNEGLVDAQTHFLPKPFSLAELRRAVHEACENSSRKQA